MTWTLYEGDCLDIMRQLESESFDAVITDPPYGINYQSCRTKDKNRRLMKIANDKRPFIWWLYDAYRIVKDKGALACFCRWDVQEIFRQAIECAGFKIKSQVIWDRGVHGTGDLKAQFAPQHDVIWFAVKGAFKFPAKRPVSIIRGMRINGLILLHPNEKPVSIMQEIISAITPPDGTIIDPFAGSGTTGVASESLNIKSTMIELDPKYCNIIRQRMEREVKI